jgi:hypothetical protein
MKLYTAVRDYIQNDTAARGFFGHPEPFQLWVLDEPSCFDALGFWQIEGWLEWIGVGRDEQQQVEDSLRRHAVLTPCPDGRIPALQQLSTTEDRRYAVVFMQIDSTFLSGNYIASAYLYDNASRAATHGEIVAAYPEGMIYFIVFGKDGQIRKVFSDRVFH